MKAAVFHAPGDVRVQAVPEPAPPGPGELLVKVAKAALCGTDSAEWAHGPLLARPPVVLGHEFTGRVVAAGPGAGVPIGTRVVSGAGISCGGCEWCAAGRTNLCASYQTLGLHRDGGLAEFVLSPAAICRPVPDGLDDTGAAMAQPLAVALHAARRGQVAPGRGTVVIGTGGIGAFIVAAAASLGAGPLIAVDVADARLSTAAALGATVTVNAGRADPVAAVLAATGGRGAHVVIEASGAASSPAAALSMVRRGGDVVIVGLQPAPLAVDLFAVSVREVGVHGTLAHVCADDLGQAVTLLATTPLAATVLGAVIPLADLVDGGLRPLAERTATGKLVVDVQGSVLSRLTSREDTMRALRFHQAHQLSVEAVPEPGAPGPGQVLLKPLMCGICGTDLHEYTDGPIVTPASPHPLTGAELPQIMGHEFAAVVAETGPGVSHVRDGDLCTVMPLIACGRCHECVRGQGHLCRTMACTGLSSAWGGLADLAIVSATQVVGVPEPVTARQAALIEPTAVAAYGVDRGRLQPGQTVLITGAGPIGSLATLYALAAGARVVIVSEPDPSRRQRASVLGEGLGEVIVADPASDSVPDIVTEVTRGVGADLAIECAGQQSALALCIDVVRPAGTVVQTALHIRPAAIRADLLALKDLTLAGTWCYPVQDFPRVVGLVAAGRLPVERVISSVVPLEAAVTGGFDRLIARGTGEVKVLIEVGS